MQRKSCLFSSLSLILYSLVIISIIMSVSQIKNLQRRLTLLEKEAVCEVTRACGHELWQTLGFDALDAIDDPERRARANYYFGQLSTVRQLADVLC